MHQRFRMLDSIKGFDMGRKLGRHRYPTMHFFDITIRPIEGMQELFARPP